MENNQEITEDYLLGRDHTNYIRCDNCGYKQKLNEDDSDDDQEEIVDTNKRISSAIRTLRSTEQSEVTDKDDDSDTESVVSVSLNPIDELPLIYSPFTKEQERKPGWTAPVHVEANRDERFKWEKPFAEEETENETPAQRIRRLEQIIAEKKQDLEVLGTQYKKSQVECFRLAEELHGFKGEHYDDLKEDNVRLRQENGRIHRENVWLRSQMRRIANSKVKELEEKKKLEEKYGVKARKTKVNSSSK